MGYDPEFAKKMLAEAGYPDCEGFPEVVLLGYSEAFDLAWIEYAQENWEEVLGCEPDIVLIEQHSWRHCEFGPCPEPDPHKWTLGGGRITRMRIIGLEMYCGAKVVPVRTDRAQGQMT